MLMVDRSAATVLGNVWRSLRGCRLENVDVPRIRALVVDRFLLEGSVVPVGCGVNWGSTLSRTASLGLQSLELAWLVQVRDTCAISSGSSASSFFQRRPKHPQLS